MNNWKNITIKLPGYDFNDILNKIDGLDITSITVKDLKNNQDSEWFYYNNEPLEMHGNTHCIQLLIREDQSTKSIVKQLAKIIKLENIPFYREEILPDQDWLKKNQSDFEIINISNNLRIIAPWTKKDQYEGFNIIINPGGGFGTGSHSTTKLCLQWLEKNNIKNKNLIDYGSGSGILSIAAKMFGAKHVVGIEIDLKAIDNAMQNSKINNLNIPFFEVNKFNIDFKFDILIANILSKTLIELKPAFKSLTKKRIILCGILDKQVSKVIDHYSNWVTLRVKQNLDGWNLLEGKL